jgi:ParB family chromosome partitioning protein
MTATQTQATTTTIPLNKLIVSADNVRKTGGGIGIDELAASISAHGVLQNLIVRFPEDDAKGRYEVIAGGRRLAALHMLAKSKKIAKTFPVPCVVRAPDEATELSLAENTKRLAMHPADEFAAYHALSQQGHQPATIALRFGVSTRHVAQRLKLANVSPRLLDVFRADEMTLEHLMALTVTDDHAVQERVWAQTGSGWHPNSIRRRLTEADVAVTDKRVRFIGLDSYEAGGGTVKRDLFSDDEDGWIEDATLLDRLASEKLARMVPALEAEGWKWVQITTGYPGPTAERLRRIYAKPVPLTEDEEARREKLAEEWDELASLADGGGLTDEQEARHREIDAELAAFETRAEGVFTTEQKATAGVFLYLDPDGKPQTAGGYVRPEDEQRGQDAEHHEPGGDQEGIANDEDGTDDAEPGRVADRPQASESTDAPTTTLSATLAAELQAHRTAAMQAMLADRPDLALRVATFTLAQQVFRLGYVRSMVGLHITKPSMMAAPEIGETPAGKALASTQERLGSAVPGCPDDLWQWLMEQDIAVVSDLFAFCIAQGLDAGAQDWTEAPDCFPAKLAQGLGLNMGDWWRPTVDSFFGKVTKATMLHSVKEAAGPSVARQMDGMKKDTMAKAAEEAVKGTTWLPTLLRVPEQPAG